MHSLIGQLRIALILSVALGLVSFWIDVFSGVDRGGLPSAPFLDACAGWRVHLCLGAGGFVLMALPVLVGALVQWRLLSRLKDCRVLPRNFIDRSPWSGQAAALTAVAVAAVALPVMLYAPMNETSRREVESMVLPQATAGQDGPPGHPRLVINVLRGGIVRIWDVTYWDAELAKGLEAESALELKTWEDSRAWTPAQDVGPHRDWHDLRLLVMAKLAAHPGPGGHSQVAVHIRADAYGAYAHVQALLELCRELGVRRISFGVAPKYIGPHVPPPPPPAEP